MWPWGAGASPSCVVARELADADAGCRSCVIDVLVYSILVWPGVCRSGLKVLVLIRAMWSLVDKALQVLLLGCTGIASGLSWTWSFVGAGCCIVVSCCLLRGVVRRPEVISEDFLKLALKRTDWIKYFLKLTFRKAVWMKEKWWLIGWLCWICSYDWLDSTSSALSGGKDTDPMFGNLVWWWGCGRHAAGKETYLSFGFLVATSSVYIVLVAATLHGRVKKNFCTLEVPLLDIINNEILHYSLERNLLI